MERVEEMDLDEEEEQEYTSEMPWIVEKWLGGLPEQPAREQEFLDCASSFPSTSRANLGIDSGIISSPLIIPESMSKLAPARDEGSDFDSDLDDAFNEVCTEITTGHGVRRGIPNDEEIDEPIRDVVNAVEMAMDEAADRVLGVSDSYNWEEGFESFRGVPEFFSGPVPGPLKDYDTPYDAFTAIWSSNIIQHIVQETNRYAKHTIDSMRSDGRLKPTSRLLKWTDTDVDEIMVFLSIVMYMGIDSRSSQHEYWGGGNILEMPKFREAMSYNRYILLSKFLHFVDNSVAHQNRPQSEERLSLKLLKLEPIILHLNSKFSSLYNLKKEICIDESLTLFKGRLSWVQAIRSKAARFGLKSFELCESQSGYLYKFQIYTGKKSYDSTDVIAPSNDLAGKSTQVVLDLLGGLQHRGHCVTMDNFYNCPALARYLKRLGFDCLGTLRVNRRNVPSDIAKIPKNLAKGTIIARQCGDISIIAWKDTKLVSMISTYHTAETYVGSKAGKPLIKPVAVKDYNTTMGGVDLKDQKLSMYLVERKRGVKWYIKMFKRLLNVSIHNALVLHVTSLKRRNKLPLTHREFRYQLAQSLLDQHLRPGVIEIGEKIGQLMRLRRDITHDPKYSSGNTNRKRCVVCQRQGVTKLVNSQCVTCNEYLCFEGCWKKWHSQTKLEGQEIHKRIAKRRN